MTATAIAPALPADDLQEMASASPQVDTATAVAEIRAQGYTVLPSLLPVSLIDRWQAAFLLLWQDCDRAGVPDNRGPHRRYLDLPFSYPFQDPQVHAHPAILAIAETILGKDCLLLHLGTDTPGPGSQDQDWHADVPQLFPETGLVTPAMALSVNIPLVDVTLDNGPFECRARQPPADRRGRHARACARGRARCVRCCCVAGTCWCAIRR